MSDDKWLCKCTGNIPILTELPYIGHAPLTSSQHTDFTPMICKKCGGITAIPSDNFNLFLTAGEPNAVESVMNALKATVRFYRKVNFHMRWTKLVRTYAAYGLGGVLGGAIAGLFLVPIFYRISPYDALHLWTVEMAASVCVTLIIGAIIELVYKKI